MPTAPPIVDIGSATSVRALSWTVTSYLGSCELVDAGIIPALCRRDYISNVVFSLTTGSGQPTADRVLLLKTAIFPGRTSLWRILSPRSRRSGLPSASDG